MKVVRNIILILLVICGLSSCNEENFIKDSAAGIHFSMDTLYFDTVFTTLSTFTKNFTIYNPHKEYIRISELRLGGGSQSVFRINVDGVSGTEFHDIDIAPKDSLFVFVEATLSPNNSGDILLQQDSVITVTNGKTQDIDLVAWGQDVHMIRGEIIPTTTWQNDKPYLIIDYAIVDSLETLTIEPGVRVYFHKNAVLYVGGTLLARGDTGRQILFAGDRLEREYEDIPGQWGGIYFYLGSFDNVLDYTIVRGGNFGMRVDSVMNSNPTLTISNSIIAHQSSIGILGVGATIEAYNDLIYNCGSSALFLTIGGNYEFNQCTIANNYTESPARRNPSVYMDNYYIYNDTLDGGTIQKVVELRDIEKAYFGNCIIYGNLPNEILINKHPDGILNYEFVHCLMKFNQEGIDLDDPDHFTNNINFQDPLFVSWRDYNFQLDSLSPARNKGLLSIGEQFPLDLKRNSRTFDGKPDIGAYEWEGGAD